jgi:3-methyladenine DNA glycosylase AlkD
VSPAADQVLAELRTLGSEANRAGMARYGIAVDNAYGVAMRDLRPLARRLGRSHALAADLWASKIHEARILASIVDVPKEVTEAQMDAWAADFDSWDLCDQCCSNLFRKTPFAVAKARQWAARDETFVKRAGFALMAYLGGHDPKTSDEALASFLELIEREATDDRNFVKKAVNWALREIGKRRGGNWHARSLALAERLKASDSRPARWIGSDAARELRSRQVILGPGSHTGVA